VTSVLVAACASPIGDISSPWGDGNAPIAVRCVPPGELRALASQVSLDLDSAALRAVEHGAARCFMAFDGPTPIAHDFVALGSIDPMLNSGGRGFTGIGLRLPPTAAYVFKAWVASDWRGRGLHAHVVGHVAATVVSQGIDWLVTTADWDNAASLASFASLGFAVRGRAAEWVFGRRHVYRLPPPIALGAAELRLLRPEPAASAV